MNWRHALPYSPFVAVAVVMVVVLAVILVRLAQPPAPPLSYTQGEYTAERPIYAPGDTLVYTASLTIERAGAVQVVRGWRARQSAARVRLCDGTNAPVVQDTPPPFPPDAVGTEVEGRIEVPVPELPPGDYWLVSTVKKDDGGEAISKVGVIVERPCPGGG